MGLEETSGCLHDRSFAYQLYTNQLQLGTEMEP